MEQQVTRRERERQVRRRTMLEAARAVIAEKGFKQATLDEIAHRAEFGKGTIYNYFPEGKDEMLFAILDEVYDDLVAIAHDSLNRQDDAPFRDRLTEYVRSSLEYFARQLDLFVILMKEANRIAFGENESIAIYFKRHHDRLLEAMEPSISKAIETGEVRPYPADSLSHMILGNVHGYLRHFCFRSIGNGNTRSMPEIDAERGAAFLSGILLDGLANPGQASVTNHGGDEETS